MGVLVPRIQPRPAGGHLLRDLGTLQRYAGELGPGMKLQNSHYFALFKKIGMFRFQKIGQKTPVYPSLTVNSVQ